MNLILSFLDWATDMWESAPGVLNKFAVLGVWIFLSILIVTILLIPIGAIILCVLHGNWLTLAGVILLLFWIFCFIRYLRDA